MKNTRYFLFSVLMLGSVIANAQFVITGKIVDSSSKEPLQGASVFCQNTTSGTISNKEGYFKLDLKSGGYDLIVTYTGYQTRVIRINSEEVTSSLDIEMAKEEKSMDEVIIRSSNEVADGWEKYGTFFLASFIGNTPFAANCTLVNPQALKFYYYKRSDKLKVLATEPLIISNKSLGYNLTYTLDSFMYYYKDEMSSYRGYTLFAEMDGTPAQRAQWNTNRRKAYLGSKLHFMRSYYDSTLTQDGFRIAILKEDDDLNFDAVNNPYDSNYYYNIDSTLEVEIYFPRKISITYIKRTPENEYLQQYKLPNDIGVQITYADILDPIAIKQNGYYYDQRDWINQGYWSWKNLADQVPYDYNP